MNYLVLDTETSSSSVNYLSFLQFASCLFDERFREIDGTRFNVRCRIRPTVVPNIGALLANSIRVPMLQGANLSHHDAVMQIHTYINKVSPVTALGHNIISFDLEAYIRQLYKNLIPDVYYLKKKPNLVMDTLNLARASKLVDDKNLKCEISPKGSFLFKLGSLCKANNIKHEQAHEAMSDVLANAELARLLFKRSPEVWNSALKTAHKSETQKVLERNKIISHVQYFYGRSRWYANHWIFNHPDYTWGICWDLRHSPTQYLNLGYKALETEMKKSPKFLRTIKQNRNESLLDSSYALKAEPYNKIGIKELMKRVEILDKNPKFIELMKTILHDQAEEKQTIDQTELIPEEPLYKDGFPSESEQRNMELFHTLTWKDRLPLIEKFSEKYSFFAKVLFYEEHPELLPKSIYNEIHRLFASRLLSTNDVKWETVPKFYKELDDMRAKFDKQENEDGLKLLDEYNQFVQEIEKKFENA